MARTILKTEKERKKDRAQVKKTAKNLIREHAHGKRVTRNVISSASVDQTNTLLMLEKYGINNEFEQEVLKAIGDEYCKRYLKKDEKRKLKTDITPF